MLSAAPVVVDCYRTTRHSIKGAKANKVASSHYLSQASAFRHSLLRLLGGPTKIFFHCLLETALTAGTVRTFSIKSVLK